MRFVSGHAFRHAEMPLVKAPSGAASAVRLHYRPLISRSHQRVFRVPHPIAKRNASPRDRRNAIARNNNPHQVQRVRSRDHNPFASVHRQLTMRPQRFDRDRKRELLSQESIDESPAAHFSAIFEPAIADLQFAPARQIRFPHQQVAEDPEKRLWQRPGKNAPPAPCARTLVAVADRRGRARPQRRVLLLDVVAALWRGVLRP